MTTVNSWNEWDQLKHVIVGTVDKSKIVFDNKINLSVDDLEKENITWLRKYMVN